MAAEVIKAKLMGILNEMAEVSKLFVKKPGESFIRKRKLSFVETIRILLSMGGSCLNRELLEHFNYATRTATASAFVQQREKILPEAFEYLFREFTDSLSMKKDYGDYRLLGTDGGDIKVQGNPKDHDAYIQTSQDAHGYNLLHLNALYDLCNRLYVDYTIQLKRGEMSARRW